MPNSQSAPSAPRSRSFVGYLLVFFIFTTAIVGWQLWQVKHTVSNTINGPVSTQVYFSPNGGCTDAIVGALADARKRVLVQGYEFTSKPIAQALVDARIRGVEVRIILDKKASGDRSSKADFVTQNGIATFIDPVHSIAHNKIIIIDDATVITGSFNFTRAAEEHNAENLLVLHNTELAALYTKNWEYHLSHSEPYAGR